MGRGDTVPNVEDGLPIDWIPAAYLRPGRVAWRGAATDQLLAPSRRARTESVAVSASMAPTPFLATSPDDSREHIQTRRTGRGSTPPRECSPVTGLPRCCSPASERGHFEPVSAEHVDDIRRLQTLTRTIGLHPEG